MPSFKPNSRPPVSGARLVATLAVAAGLGGCGTDAPPVAPAGPPVLGIAALLPAGAAAVERPEDGACVELGHDPNHTLTVLVGSDPQHPGQIENWILLPPSACIGTPQCGYVVVTVDADPNALVVASVALSVDTPLARLATPLGDHGIAVELRNSDGTPALDARGKPFRRTLSIHVAEHCGAASPDAGLRPPVEAGLVDASVPDAAPPPLPDASPVVPVDAASPRDAAPASDAAVSRTPDGGLALQE